MNFLSIDCSIGSGSLFVKAKNKTFSKFLQSDKYSNDKYKIPSNFIKIDEFVIDKVKIYEVFKKNN